MDLENLLAISEAITISAIERRESRGGHFRDDFPDKDPEAAKWNSVIKRNADGSMNYRKETIPPLPPELAAIIEEQKS
jgi:succinate dehydrogenase / fumarate reductase flavoprotein subunit